MSHINFKQENSQPYVSVLVPAFQAERFVCDTLNSLEKQTYKKIELLISIDQSNDDTDRVVTRWSEEHNSIYTRIFRQNNRLGWVKNINFLLEKCQNQYFMLLPHDDLLHKNYIKILLQCLQMNVDACVAYSDIKCFGKLERIITQVPLSGERFERVLKFLNYHFNAVAFRGLVNKSLLSDLLLIPENDYTNFAKDTTWNLQMVIKGKMIRIPRTLYYKRYQDNSVHDDWQKLTREEKVSVWLEHCRDCLNVVNRVGFDKDERLSLIKAIKLRLLQKVAPLWSYPDISSLNKEEQNSLITLLEE